MTFLKLVYEWAKCTFQLSAHFFAVVIKPLALLENLLVCKVLSLLFADE